MSIGTLDTKITIQSPTPTTSGMGVVSNTWGTLAEPWAKKRHLKGQEFEQAQQIAAETETKFVIRYSSDVSALSNDDRISQGGEVYDILSVIPIPGGRPRMLEIYSKKRTVDNA